MPESARRHITHLDDLNARLWAWLEQLYHRTPHAGLNGMTPLARYQQDLPKIRSLGPRAAQLDALFHHRINRFVRKDGTVSYNGIHFEVPFELAGKNIRLVVDPHAGTVLGVENESGEHIGSATALDTLANIKRVRRKPAPVSDTPSAQPPATNLVELAYQQYHGIKEA